MAAQEPGQQPSLTALPRLEDLPKSGDGYDPDKVREAFEAFRRHSAQLQAQLRVLQAASRSGQSVEPTGHAVRMDALHLIRTASEFADTVEADAQKASEAQLSKTEEEVRRRVSCSRTPTAMRRRSYARPRRRGIDCWSSRATRRPS